MDSLQSQGLALGASVATLAPKASPWDWRESMSFTEPKVLALQTSFTKEVEEKSIDDFCACFWIVGSSKSISKETLKL